MKGYSALKEKTNSLQSSIEWIAEAKGWNIVNRNESEVAIDIKTPIGEMGLFFLHDAKTRLLQISVVMDVMVDPYANPGIYELLALINEKARMGHFAILKDTAFPIYRNCVFFDDRRPMSREMLYDLTEIAAEESYRYFEAFRIASQGYDAKTCLTFALNEIMGRA